jgi:hypothetical protein
LFGIIHVFENQNLKLFSLCFFLSKISIILTKLAGFAFKKKLINFLFEDRTKNKNSNTKIMVDYCFETEKNKNKNKRDMLFYTSCFNNV